MSNRLFQGLVYQMRDTVDRMIGVIDESATIIACSDLTKIGEPNDFLAADLGENNELFIRDGITYKPFGSKMKSEYAVFVSGSDDLAAKMCGVLSISLSSIKQYYDEKYDRGNFIKNIILDNHPARRYLCQGAGAALFLRCQPRGAAGAGAGQQQRFRL